MLPESSMARWESSLVDDSQETRSTGASSSAANSLMTSEYETQQSPADSLSTFQAGLTLQTDRGDTFATSSSDTIRTSMAETSTMSEQDHRRNACRHQASLSPQRRSLESNAANNSRAAANTNIDNNNNLNNGAAVANGGIRPWVLMLVFSVVQFLFSSILPPSGGVVNASSDQVSSPGTSNGGSGNSANAGSSGGGHGGAGYNSQHYFRQLPPITNPSKSAGKIVTERMTESRRLLLRQEAKDMFFHGYHGYLHHAFPKDELNPIACIGRGPDKRNPKNINVNDVLGDYSLTLIDALDTLAVMREPEKFRQAIDLVTKYVGNFNIDSRVQVFEVNIRVLGALLSGHLYASDPSYKSVVKGYKGELLTMAKDLGKRLMKAFENSPTGIPWPRVNLKRGVLPEESSETCVAGAGSLLLEFGVLSRLTGDKSFEEAAKRALFELWDRRSTIGLVGNTINITSGQWMSAMTGIGAGTDSFYEYLLKSYVLLGGDEYLEMYETAQESIRRNLMHDSKYFYKHVHLDDGSLMATWVDSLSAFMPGVQVLAGDLESAIKNHLYYYNIWRKYQAIPERFNFATQSVDIANYPLRPEFIESNYFLYRATKDPFYLEVGEMILRDLQKYTKTKCGWSSLHSVIDKKPEDRMESFALSETFKYLFLLFDEENLLHHELKDTNFVFTTEGHVLSLSSKYLVKEYQNGAGDQKQQHTTKSSSDQLNNQQGRHRHHDSRIGGGPVCEPYRAPETFVKSIPYRPDADFARQMVGTRADARDIVELDPKGICEKPTLEIERVVVEFSGPPKKTFFEDEDEDGGQEGAGQKESKWSTSGEAKELVVIPIKKGVFVNRIVGVKMQLQYDDTNNGYRAVKVADHPLSLNSNVYIEQSSMRPLWDSLQRAQDAHLRIFKTGPPGSTPDRMVKKDLLITPADFGSWKPSIVDYNQQDTSSETHQTSLMDHIKDTITQQRRTQQQQQQQHQPDRTALRRTATKQLIHIQENEKGCRPFTNSQSNRIKDKILVVNRGGCLFILKAYYAQAAEAHGIVIINTEESTFPMTGTESKGINNNNNNNPPKNQQEQSAGPSTKADPVQIGEGILDDAIDIHSVMVGQTDGRLLLDWMQEADTFSDPISTDADPRSEQNIGLVAGFIQKKVTKEQRSSAQLSYNSLPIVNIFPMSIPMATNG
ncbi:alpha mannosidase-like protein [Mortierella polycephala]|uniref:alpha-1,2-Mannosidase n=1 Tax=Mortierella polycephala TaxID=41804 RepID=A0A9P6QDF3_9FUNG|nr:alpha mannosidase-like protein [Mortierella polycephala]